MKHRVTLVAIAVVVVVLSVLSAKAYDRYKVQHLLQVAHQQETAAQQAETKAQALKLYQQAAQNLQAYCQKVAAQNVANVGQKTDNLQAPDCSLPPIQ